MPSILLFTNDFGPRAGGIETFIIGLLERLPRGEVIVLTSNQGDTDTYDRQWLDDYGVVVIRDRTRILLPTPRVIRSAIKIIRERGIRTVWFGAAAPLAFSARWLKKSGAQRFVAMSHGHEVWWSKIPPFSWAMREIGKQVDQITYLGEYTGKVIGTKVPASKLVRIAPGIDVQHFRPRSGSEMRARHGVGTRPAIVSVGRLVHRKGQDRLVEALPVIKKEIPDALLIFIGEGPHREELDKLAKKHGLVNDILFIGRIDYRELPSYIAMGDIFAMPCRNRLGGLEVEGLGIVYLEASACGLPVIAGNSGGAPDAVRHGQTGFVVDGENVDEIAARAIELLQDQQLRERLGSQGREWISEEWNWDIWSKKFNELLKVGSH
ncbi:MAG: glycosyltransferase family 1 protein [Actinobacteria bacterium]|nr:glycosyltransferase family 1 protein [Actinomycetota bacterium]